MVIWLEFGTLNHHPNVKYLVLLKLLPLKVWYYLNFPYLCGVIKKQVVTIKTNSHENFKQFNRVQHLFCI